MPAPPRPLLLAAVQPGAAEVLLYTGLDNPVPNFIYQRPGYRAVEYRVVLAFLAPESTVR